MDEISKDQIIRDLIIQVQCLNNIINKHGLHLNYGGPLMTAEQTRFYEGRWNNAKWEVAP